MLYHPDLNRVILKSTGIVLKLKQTGDWKMRSDTDNVLSYRYQNRVVA
jgi:hypothetical protein